MSQRRGIKSGSRFEAEVGYSRAIVQGDWVVVSGTAGYDFRAGTISPDPAEQARQALRTIAAALAEADATLADIIRLRVYLSDRAYVDAVSRVLKATFPDGLVTNTTVIVGFANDEMKVELEVTALKGGL